MSTAARLMAIAVACLAAGGPVVCHCLGVTEDDLVSALITLELRRSARSAGTPGPGPAATACHRKHPNLLDTLFFVLAGNLFRQVALQPDRLDQVQLRLQPVDVLLGIDQDLRPSTRVSRCP